MDRNRCVLAFTILCSVGLLMGGCGGNQQVAQTQVPATEPAAMATPTPEMAAATPVPPESYLVQKGDCLWTISAKPKVYGDAFMWPLIFKSNRDRIQDPDLIYPDQQLTVIKPVSAEEAQQAKKLADETPKYVPHSTPVKKTVLDYF